MDAPTGAEETPHSAFIILPTLNERAGLVQTFQELPLEHLRRAGFEPRVLVIDGGSTDGTLEIAGELGATVLRQSGARGKGNGVRQALAFALEQNAEFVTVIDADYSYVADTLLPAFSLLADGTDLVIGARRPASDPSETVRTVVHRVADAMLSLTAARMSGVPFLDICSGLWGVRLDAVRQVTLESDGFEIEAELFLKMARHGFHVSQVPVTYRPRLGEAKLHAVRDGSRILLTIIHYSRALSRAGAPVRLHYVPPGSPNPRTAPSQEWLREVEALCFSVGPPRLSIIADPQREQEAHELARHLWAGEIHASVTVSPTATATGSVGEPDLVGATPSVRLPALLDAPTSAKAIVRVPQSHALFYVDPWIARSGADPRMYRSGGYRRPRTAEAPRSFVAGLAAAFNGSPEARSNALLFATAGGLGVLSAPSGNGGWLHRLRLGRGLRSSLLKGLVRRTIR